MLPVNVNHAGRFGMKKLGLALVLVVCWVATASAARVYLKDGSWINAKKVWRHKAKVVVLVNRDSITSFTNEELNLKKTFPPRKKRIKKTPPVVPASVASTPVAAPAAAPALVVTPPPKEGKQLTVPNLRMKLPEREPPKLGGGEGSIRKQKQEMEKRLNE
jgi:hypothetical protein